MLFQRGQSEKFLFPEIEIISALLYGLVENIIVEPVLFDFLSVFSLRTGLQKVFLLFGIFETVFELEIQGLLDNLFFEFLLLVQVDQIGVDCSRCEDKALLFILLSLAD